MMRDWRYFFSNVFFKFILVVFHLKINCFSFIVKMSSFVFILLDFFTLICFILFHFSVYLKRSLFFFSLIIHVLIYLSWELFFFILSLKQTKKANKRFEFFEYFLKHSQSGFPGFKFDFHIYCFILIQKKAEKTTKWQALGFCGKEEKTTKIINTRTKHFDAPNRHSSLKQNKDENWI